jgi:hypothetical protein
MSEKLKCSIEYDDSWLQEDCHWNIERFFIITYKVLETFDNIEFYYKLGPKVDFNTAAYDRVYLDKLSKISDNPATYEYVIKLSDIDFNTLLATRTDEGWLQVTACIRAKNEESDTIYETYNTFDYYLELPPVMLEPEAPLKNIRASLVTHNPGEVILSWDKAIELDNSYAENSPDCLDGYCIELFHKGKDSEAFVQVSGLSYEIGLDSDELAKGNRVPIYKLKKIEEPSVEINVPEILEGEEEIISFVGQGTTSEVYLDYQLEAIENGIDVEKPRFSYVSRELGIEPGDSYKFVIYPYSHYEGALLSSQGSKSEELKVSKGVVRVRTADSWAEAQVWVFAETANGPKWVQAEAIYTRADDSTGKGVWKEAI